MQIKRQNTARIFEQAQCITSYRAVKILLAWMYMVKLFIASAQLLLQVGRSPNKPDDMKALAEKFDRRHGWLLRIVLIAVLLGTAR